MGYQSWKRKKSDYSLTTRGDAQLSVMKDQNRNFVNLIHVKDMNKIERLTLMFGIYPSTLIEGKSPVLFR